MSESKSFKILPDQEIILSKAKKKKDEKINLKKIKKDIVIKNNKDTKYSICSSPILINFYKIKKYINSKEFDLFIFIGKLNDDEKEIFEKLNTNDEDKKLKEKFDDLDSNEKSIINRFFLKYNTKSGTIVKKEIFKQNKNCRKIKFIFALINDDDSIKLIKNKIFVYLSNESKKDYIPPNNQYLWIYTKEDMSKKEIAHLFNDLSDQTTNIKKSDLIPALSKIFGLAKKDVEKGLESIQDSITMDEFKNLFNKNPIFKNKHYQLLGKEYKNVNNSNIQIYGNAFKKIDTDKNFVNKKNGKKIDIIEIDDHSKILNDYYNIFKNEINLIDIKDYFVEVKKKYKKYDNQLKYGLIKKYWNTIEDDINLTTDFKKKENYVKKYKELSKTIKHRENIVEQLIELYPNAMKEIKYNICSLLMCVIHVNFPGNYEFLDLDKIFNGLELTRKIPFIKYKSDLSFETKYKVFKAIVEIQKNGKPYISKKKIDSWRKNITYENKKKKIKGIPKGLSIKYLLHEDEEEKKFSTINIFKDGKIEIKLYWTQNIQADLNNVIVAMQEIKNFIQSLNKLNISNLYNPYKKIVLPDEKFLLKRQNSTNTNLISLNTLIELDDSEIDLSKIIFYSKCFYNFISIIDQTENLKKNVIHFRYKKISNYGRNFKIDNYILKLFKEFLSDPERNEDEINIMTIDTFIIEQLEKNLQFTKDEAKKKYETWKNNDTNRQLVEKLDIKFVYEILPESGIDIKIQKSISTNNLKIMTEGIKNKFQLQRINFFLKTLFYVVKQNDDEIQKKLGCNIELTKTLDEDHDDDDSEKLKTMDSDAESDVSGLGWQLDISDDDEEESDEDEEQIITNDDVNSQIEDDETKDKQKEKEINDKKLISKKESIQGQNKIRAYSLERLYSADPDLFDPSYSRICGSEQDRQPIVISKAEKDKIDKINPNSYDKYLNYSTNGRDNYYICPKYWCIKCKMPLKVDQVFNTETIITSKIIEIKSDIKKKNDVELIKIKNDLTTEDKIKLCKKKDSTIFNNDVILIWKEEKLPNIIIQEPNESKITWSEGNEILEKKDYPIKINDTIDLKIIRNKHGICPFCNGKFIKKGTSNRPKDETILVRKASYWFKKKAYPGFLDKMKHPDGYCMPCCFKKWDTEGQKKKRDECLNPEKSKKIVVANNGKYVKGAEKFPLEIEKLGMLPNTLNILFENDIEKMVSNASSGLLNDNIKAYVRRGIKQSNYNSLLNAAAYISNNEWNYYDDTKFIIEVLFKNLTLDIFVSLNNGDLINIFKDNEAINSRNFIKFKDWIHDEKNLNFLTKNNAKYLLRINNFPDINDYDDNNKLILNRLFSIYTSFINYKSYLLSTAVKKDIYLLDLLSRKGVVYKNGMNIFILNAESIKNLNNIYLLCPNGINLRNYIDENQESCFLLKIGKFFEPIVSIESKNGKIIQNKRFLFNSKKDEDNRIKHILKNFKNIINDNCEIIQDPKYINYLEKEKINFNKNNALETIQKLKKITKFKDDRLKIVSQFVNYFNNVIGLELKNGILDKDKKNTFFPVLPSAIVVDENLSINKNISDFKFKNIIDSYIIYHNIYTILQGSDNRIINCDPINLIHNHNKIVGLQLKDGNIVPIEPIENVNDPKFNELLEYLNEYNTDKNLYIVKIKNFLLKHKEFISLFEDYNATSKNFKKNPKDFKNVIKMLEKILHLKKVDLNYFIQYGKMINLYENIHDERVDFMNKIFFENETYERIKYEISKFLNIQQKMKSKKSITRTPRLYKKIINDIINSPILTINEKRVKLKTYIIELIVLLATFGNDKKKNINNYNYKFDIERKRCNLNSNQNSCNQESHCIWELKSFDLKKPISSIIKKKYKTKFNRIFDLFSNDLTEEEISNGIMRAEKNIKKFLIKNSRNNKIDDHEKESILFKEIETILNKIKIENLEKKGTIQKLGGKCKLFIYEHNLIDGKLNIDKYSSLIVEDLIKNKIKRKEILEGFVTEIIQDSRNSKFSDNLIFTDNEYGLKKLNNLYEKGNNLNIKNPNLQFFKIIEEDHQKYNLPQIWQKKLGNDFEIIPNDYLNDSIPEIIYGILSKYSPLKKNYEKKVKQLDLIVSKDLSTQIIKENYLEFLKKQPISYLINHLQKNDQELKSDPIHQIKTFAEFEDYMNHNNYWFTLSDIQILSKIIGLNIIVLGRKNIKTNPTGINIYYDEKNNKDFYIIIFKKKIVNSNKYKFELISLNTENGKKIIFPLKDLPKQFIALIHDSTKPHKKTKIIVKKKSLNKF